MKHLNLFSNNILKKILINQSTIFYKSFKKKKYFLMTKVKAEFLLEGSHKDAWSVWAHCLNIKERSL